MTIHIPDSRGNTYTITQIAKKVNRSYSCVMNWYKRKGADTYEKLLYRGRHSPSGRYGKKVLTPESLIQLGYKKFPDPPKEEIVTPLSKFNRFAVCTRCCGELRCKYYTECSDCRLFENKHHERFKEDGSCYEEAKK